MKSRISATDTNNVAINSLPRDGRGACLQTGFCTSGCVAVRNGQRFTEIPKAEQTGHFELRPESMAIRIEHDTSGKVDSVWYLDRNGVLCKQKARFVCVAGNAIETSRLLLNSTSEQFPDGLANRSGQVGRNYMRHMIAGVVGACLVRSICTVVPTKPGSSRMNGRAGTGFAAVFLC